MLNRERDHCGTLVHLWLCEMGILVFLFCVLVLGQGAREAVAEGEFLYVKGSNVNIRSGPGTDNDIVAKVNRNHKMMVIARKGRWFQVKLSSGDGATGWIREDLVSEAPTERRQQPTRVKPPSASELSTPAGVVIALDKAPTERVVEAFRVAIGAAGQSCGAVTGMARKLVQPEGVYYVVGCDSKRRYSVLVKPDGKMGTKVTLCDRARRLAGVDLCASG